MKLNMQDWEEINDPAFVDDIKWASRGSRRLENKVIRRFNLRGAQTKQGVVPGEVTILDDWKKMVVSWSDLKDGETKWKRADSDGHYGWLHFIAPINGQYMTWWIEKLRHPGETGGTGGANQLYAPAWKYEDGRTYADVWAVFFDGKLDSPVRDRSGENLYRPPKGSLCGVWVGGWQPGGANARTDIFPFRYEGAEPPPPPPPPPGGTFEDGIEYCIKTLEDLLD
jgi:hypothetical protein